jgi:hypothetical protein
MIALDSLSDVMCIGSLDGWREDIWELLAAFGEGGLHDDSVDVPEVGDLLERVVLGIILQDLVEGVTNQQRVLKLRQLSQLVQLVPTRNPVV